MFTCQKNMPRNIPTSQRLTENPEICSGVIKVPPKFVHPSQRNAPSVAIVWVVLPSRDLVGGGENERFKTDNACSGHRVNAFGIRQRSRRKHSWYFESGSQRGAGCGVRLRKREASSSADQTATTFPGHGHRQRWPQKNLRVVGLNFSTTIFLLASLDAWANRTKVNCRIAQYSQGATVLKNFVLPMALAVSLSGCVIIVGNLEKMEDQATGISCTILFGGIEFGCHHRGDDGDAADGV